ncbi:alpha-1-antitrypsin homolog [Erpetoichthys calabaricus]|uniref:Thyroxine-binding globulin n=1 Tax=Erpetoichthys calabaricus TaxID=27687 RepID=A0A8C4THH8_ERPCA|nr:alpha-1-antitrypsin homolog [Erpetoichthys calabaricus]
MKTFVHMCLIVILLCSGIRTDDSLPHEDRDTPQNCHIYSLAIANADFGLGLYHALSSLEDMNGKNIFFSPLSVSRALSMVALGAAAETHDQLFKALGFNKTVVNETVVNSAFMKLFDKFQRDEKELQLDTGSAIFLKEGFKPNDQFLEDIKHYFESEGFLIDFSETEKAKNVINDYISQKTHGNIENLVNKLDPSSLMILVNYIYFKGKWEKPFNPKLTHKESFNVDNNTVIQVKMMTRNGKYDVYEDENLTAVLLPYKGNSTMMLVLPKPEKFKQVEQLLNRDEIGKWIQTMERTNIHLHVPKFSVSTSYSLKDSLKNMGVTDLFEGDANLSRITDKIKLKVSQFSHKAVLTVDEVGTEASAGSFSEIMPLRKPPVIKLNRPFILMIIQKTTDQLLFMGKIANPKEM